MENQFEPLSNKEIVSFERQEIGKEFNLELNTLTHCNLRNDEFATLIIQKIKLSNETINKLFIEGIPCEVLKFGSQGWQKGKAKIRMNVEFCPDETEVIETPTNNQPETSQPESPLDDLRRMINQESDK